MKFLHRFFSSEASGGIVLIIAAAAAMVLANLGMTRAGAALFSIYLAGPDRPPRVGYSGGNRYRLCPGSAGVTGQPRTGGVKNLPDGAGNYR